MKKNKLHIIFININTKVNIFKYISSIFKTSKQTKPDVLKIQKEGTELAVQYAKNFNLKLNYSVESIKYVDKILNSLSKKNLDDNKKEELQNISLIFGLYVIEVFEQNIGNGFLERKLIALENDSFPYYTNGKLVFPCIWCLNRVFIKDSEEIWVLFNQTTNTEI